MDAQALIANLSRRGIRLIPNPPKLSVEPASKLTDQDREAIRTAKPELLALLTRGERQAVMPDSRHPLVAPEVRAKIEAIEAEARAKGWPAELLWNGSFWDRPRGLAAILEAGDEIVEVTADGITILKLQRDMQTFRRHTA